MDASEYAHICKVGLERFAEDADGLLRHLEAHKVDVRRAADSLHGDSRSASIDLLRLFESAKQRGASPQFLADARAYLKAIVDELLDDGLKGYEITEVPEKSQLKHFFTVILPLLISVTVLLVGNNVLIRLHVLEWLEGPSRVPSLAIRNSSLAILHIAQLIIIGVILFRQRTRLDNVQRKIKKKDIGWIGQETLRQFRRSWLLMWWMWLIFYGWLSLGAWFAWPPSPGIRSVTDGLDLISGFAIWLCFFALDLPSVKLPPPERGKAGEADSDEGKEPDRDQPYRDAIWVASVAGLGCLVLSVSDRFWNLHYVGVALVGLYGGLALASLTGRLGSHHIGMPRWMLLFLYLYSMIQLFYSFFDLLHPEWQIAVYFAALALKVMLAFAGIDMLRYGGLDRYLKAADTGLLAPVKEAKKLRAARAAALKQYE